MNKIQIKSSELKNIINATFPENKKRKVYVEAVTEVTFYDLNWSGGTQNQYRACTIDGQPIEAKVDLNFLAPWKNKFEGMKIAIPKDVVIVCQSIFCGKELSLFAYVHPDNMPKYIEMYDKQEKENEKYLAKIIFGE